MAQRSTDTFKAISVLIQSCPGKVSGNSLSVFTLEGISQLSILIFDTANPLPVILPVPRHAVREISICGRGSSAKVIKCILGDLQAEINILDF